MRTLTSLDLRKAIRDKYAWPGGYDMVFITRDGGVLCADCVRTEYHQVAYERKHNISCGWNVEAIDHGGNTDGSLPCDHCSKELGAYVDLSKAETSNDPSPCLINHGVTTMDLWNTEKPVSEFGIDVPAWIDQKIDCPTVAAIVQGGCSSGAYMPAVTYYDALQTMAKHGDEVIDYIQDQIGELPEAPNSISWSSLAVNFLSAAVELWASGAYSQLEEIDDTEAA
jgi:hypothetical protein